MHHRDAELHRGVVHQEPGGEVVGAVDHRVVALEDVHDVAGVEAHVVGDDVDVRVEGGEGLLRRVDLAVADAVHVVEDLALEVGLVDHVHVDDAERADASGSQVQGSRRAEAAGAEQQDLGVEQLLLAGLADLGQEQVALVAVALIAGEGGGDLPLPALVLPLVEPAHHRDDVGVAELLEGLGRERRTGAAGAEDDDRGAVVGHPHLDVGLERPSRDVHGAGDGALLVLVGLAHVEGDRTLGLAELIGLGRGDLADGGLRGVEEISEAGHCRSSGSDAPVGGCAGVAWGAGKPYR